MNILRWLIENSKWVLNEVGATFAVTHDFTANTVISSSQMNTNFADMETGINSIEDYIGNGVITGVMLATISTAGKISGAALTALANTPSGAGVLPGANVFEGSEILLSSGSKSESGWTEITSTYADKYLRVGSTELGTGGSATLPGTSGSHVLSAAEMPAHSHGQTVGGRDNGSVGYDGTYTSSCNNPISQQSGSYATQSAGGGGGHTHDLTGVANAPLYVDVRLWQKD